MTVSSVVVEFDLLIRSQMISALCALVFNKTLPLLLMTVAFELVTLLQTHCIFEWYFQCCIRAGEVVGVGSA